MDTQHNILYCITTSIVKREITVTVIMSSGKDFLREERKEWDRMVGGRGVVEAKEWSFNKISNVL